MKILFIQTGGTIDKDYPRATGGWAFEFGEPATRRLLEKLNPSFEYEIITAFQKDSQEITETDRNVLANIILESKADKIVITHGTDTMIETAQYLAQTDVNKLVIITGAMRPERFANSDAPINIGSAIAAANLLDKGIFVAMHGVVKAYDQIQRDKQSGKFF